jgi:hypothetical protein
MNHDGHLVIAQALVLNSAPPLYTTPWGTIALGQISIGTVGQFSRSANME